MVISKRFIFYFQESLISYLKNVDTSDIQMVQFVYFSVNNANHTHLLAQIPQLRFQNIDADLNLQ